MISRAAEPKMSFDTSNCPLLEEGPSCEAKRGEVCECVDVYSTNPGNGGLSPTRYFSLLKFSNSSI